MRVILASQSPRRRELLARTGIPFEVCAADIDETMDPTLPPEQETARVSRAKAMAVACGPEDVVIAADTIVVCQGKVLGKPHSAQEAADMLRLLSGRTHQVMTGLTLRRGERILTQTEISRIHFRPLQQAEIDAYVATDEPMDKAGAYGIQGGAALFIDWLEGDYYNVMGLPLCALTLRLRELGVRIMGVST